MGAIRRYIILEGNIKALAFQMFVSQIGFGMVYTVWQPFILSTGLSVSKLGLIQSVINTTTALGLIVWGQLSDRFGRKPVLLLSDVCRFVATIIVIFLGSFQALLLFAFFVGLSAMWMVPNPARNALIAESVDEGRVGIAFSTLMAISQITSTIMASAGGYIAVVAGYSPIFYVTLIGTGVGFVTNAVYLSETYKLSNSEKIKIKTSLSRKIKGVLIPERYVWDFYMILIINGFGYTTAYSIIYGTLVDRFGFSPFQIGLILTSFNLGWGIMSIPVGNLTEKLGRRESLLASWMLALVTALGFIFSRNLVGFMLFEVVSALDISFWHPAWSSLLAEKVSVNERSTVFGKIEAYAKIVGIPAPWLAGLLYEQYGFTAPIYVKLICLGCSFFLIYRIKS
jgi:MFS family permease